jgi:hypothetical protein
MPQADDLGTLDRDPLAIPNDEEFSVDEETAAALASAIQSADEERLTDAESVRNLVKSWTSRSSTRT